MRRLLALLGATSLVAIATLTFLVPAPLVGAVPIDPTVKPDKVMNPGDTFVKHGTDLTVQDPLLAHSPKACRSAPNNNFCDVYRLKFNRDLSADAFNFVYFTLDYKPVANAPSLALVAAGLKPLAAGQLSVRIYDQEDHYLGQNYPGADDIGFTLGLVAQTPAKPLLGPINEVLADPDVHDLVGSDPGDPSDTPPGGSGPGEIPARGGFKAKQDLYDVKVYPNGLIPGYTNDYTLTVKFSNEKFAKPFEVLDPNQTANPSDGFTPTDFSPTSPSTGGLDLTRPGVGVSTDLAQLDIAPDSAIAGIGLGVNEQFDAPPTQALGGARRVSAIAKAPSGLALVLGLGVLPMVAGIFGVLVLRRRRQSLAI